MSTLRTATRARIAARLAELRTCPDGVPSRHGKAPQPDLFPLVEALTTRTVEALPEGYPGPQIYPMWSGGLSVEWKGFEVHVEPSEGLGTRWRVVDVNAPEVTLYGDDRAGMIAEIVLERAIERM